MSICIVKLYFIQQYFILSLASESISRQVQATEVNDKNKYLWIIQFSELYSVSVVEVCHPFLNCFLLILSCLFLIHNLLSDTVGFNIPL